MTTTQRIIVALTIAFATALIATMIGLAVRGDDGTELTVTASPTAGEVPAPTSTPEATPTSDPQTPTASAVPTVTAGDDRSAGAGDLDARIALKGQALPVDGATCGIEIYTISLPRGWHADPSCSHFSRQALDLGAEQTEVDLAWTLAEDLDLALARIRSAPDTWRILAEGPTIVDGRGAHWLAVELGPEAERVGVQHLYLIQIRGGTMFLAASSYAPGGLEPTRFEDNLDALETIVATIDIIDFVDCEMGEPVTVGGPAYAVDLDGDGTSERIGFTEHIGTGGMWTVWRWTCDEDFVEIFTFMERGTRQSPAWWRCRANDDGTTDLVLYAGFLQDDESTLLHAEVYELRDGELVLVEAYEETTGYEPFETGELNPACGA